MRNIFVTARTCFGEDLAEHKKAKEKDTEENKDAEQQTKNDGEKPEEKETYCLQNCQFDGRDIEGHEMINCDLCDEWYHISCVDLKVDEEALYNRFQIIQDKVQKSHLKPEVVEE